MTAFFDRFAPADLTDSVTSGMVFELVDDTLGVLDLSCGSGYVVREYDLGVPQPRVVSYPRPFSDGTLDLTSVLGARSVNLQLTLDTRVAPASQLREALMAYYHPRLRPYLRFSELNDLRWRRMWLRGDAASINVVGPTFNQMSVTFLAPDGLIWSDALHEAIANPASATPSGVGNAPAVVDNAGNAPTEWKMTIQGRVKNPVIQLDGGQLGHMRIANDFDHDGTIVLDSWRKTVVWTKADGTVVNVYSLLDGQSAWFSIPPGSHEMTLSDDLGAGGGPTNPARWANPANSPPLGGGLTAMKWSGSPDTSMVWVLDDGFATNGAVVWRDAWVA